MNNVAALRPWLFPRHIFPRRHRYLHDEEEDEV